LDEERPEDEKQANKSENKEPSPQSTTMEKYPPIQKKISSNSEKMSLSILHLNAPVLSENKKSIEEKPNSKIDFKSFEIMKILGAGAFGKVYMVKKKLDEKVYAMKALKKRDLIIKKQLRYAVTEVNVLKRCNHPFVLTLHYAFQVFFITKENLFFKEISSDTTICLFGSRLLS